MEYKELKLKKVKGKPVNIWPEPYTACHFCGRHKEGQVVMEFVTFEDEDEDGFAGEESCVAICSECLKMFAAYLDILEVENREDLVISDDDDWEYDEWTD